MEAGVPRLPRFDLVRFVSRVVVADDMNLLVFGHATTNQIAEAQPFLVSVLVHASADYAPVRRVHCRKKRSGAITFVIMGHGLAPTLFHRQVRLSAVESLNLALLITR